jgi:hypothetical protein
VSAALHCGIWECDNEEALLWHKEAITAATNNEYRAWAKNDKASNTIKIFPHESFAQFTPQEFLKSVAFYHRDLNIKDWEVLQEYCQKKGARVLVVDVPTTNLEDAKQKALRSDSGLWRLRGMAMPMKFAIISTTTPQTTTTTNTTTSPTNTKSTPQSPTKTQTNNTTTTAGHSTPVVAQPGSTTPLREAMSGFTITSPYRPASTYTPPLITTQAVGDVPVIFDPQHNVYVPVGTSPFIPQTSQYAQTYTQPSPTYTQLPYQPTQTFTQPNQTYSQPSFQTFQPQPFQTQQLPTQNLPSITENSSAENELSQAEMEEVLEGPEIEYSDSDTELLKDDVDDNITLTSTANSNNNANKI